MFLGYSVNFFGVFLICFDKVGPTFIDEIVVESVSYVIGLVIVLSVLSYCDTRFAFCLVFLPIGSFIMFHVCFMLSFASLT